MQNLLWLFNLSNWRGFNKAFKLVILFKSVYRILFFNVWSLKFNFQLELKPRAIIRSWLNHEAYPHEGQSHSFSLYAVIPNDTVSSWLFLYFSRGYAVAWVVPMNYKVKAHLIVVFWWILERTDPPRACSAWRCVVGENQFPKAIKPNEAARFVLASCISRYERTSERTHAAGRKSSRLNCSYRFSRERPIQRVRSRVPNPAM